MSAVSAIMARLGLDTSGWKKDLKSSTVDLQSALNTQAGAINGHTGVILGSQGKVKSVIKSLGADVMSGASPVQIFTDALAGLSKAFRVGMGTAVGVTAIALVGKQCYDAWTEAQKLNKELQGLLHPTNSRFTSLDEMKTSLSATQEGLKKSREASGNTASGAWAETGDNVYNSLNTLWHPVDAWNGKLKIQDSGRDALNTQKALEAQEAQLQRGIAQKEAGQINARQTGEIYGKGAEDRQNAAAKLDERKGEIARTVRDKETQRELFQNAQDGYDAEIRAIEKREKLEKESLALRGEIIDAGKDAVKKVSAEIVSLHNKLEIEKDITKQAEIQASILEKEAEKERIRAAREDALKATQGATEVAQMENSGWTHAARIDSINNDYDARIQKANDAGDTKEAGALEEQRKAKLDAARTQNALEDKELEGRKAVLAAGEDELKQADAKIDALQKEAALLGGDAKEKKEQEIAEAQFSRDKIKRSRDEAVADATSETAIMETKNSGQLSLAQLLEIELRYRDRIAAAERAGNTELANQLRTQQQLEQNAASLAEFRKTPAQRQTERQQVRKDARDEKNMQAEQESVLRDYNQGIKIDPNSRRGKSLEAALHATKDISKGTEGKNGSLMADMKSALDTSNVLSQIRDNIGIMK